MLNLLLLAADDAAAHAADAHPAGDYADVMALNWLPFVTSLVVFLIALGVLYVKVWPKIVQGLDDRNQKIRDEIARAEEAREQARKSQEEYERSLATARHEASEMIAKAKADAKAVAEQLRSQNEQDLAEMKRRTTRDIQSAKQVALAELHDEAATLAAAIAGKILQREISSSDQQRLVEESLGELENVRVN